jgi:HEPN domain-containing protein
VNRGDLQALARIRLREAKALLSAGCPDGAYYLAGYAVECALKACIAKRTKRYDFPDKGLAVSSYTHNLRELVRVAEIDRELKEALKNEDFRDNWEKVAKWTEESRYRRHGKESAMDLISAVDSTTNGVMQWVRRYW